MTSRFFGFFASACIGAFILVTSAAFIVDQRVQAIVLEFGELRRVISIPGLYWKVPWVQEILFYDKRTLAFDLPAIPITTGDQKRIVVDTYTLYRIQDPLLFFQTIKPSNEQGAGLRLEALISSTVRNVIGKIPLRSLLSEERIKIMDRIHKEVADLTAGLGIMIVDLRIIRTELPVENRQAVFARMNSELERIAKENLAKGAEQAQIIRSTAEKERTILLAEATRDASKRKGEGEALALDIVSKTLGQDPDFYRFYRSMETYEKGLGSSSMLVLSMDSYLMKIFGTPH